MSHAWARYAGRVAAVSGVGCLIAPAPPAHAQPVTSAIAVQVRITSFSPMVPKPGDSVTIDGVVTNTGATTLTNTQAIACIDDQRGRITDSAELADIPADPSDCESPAGSTAFQDFADVLEPSVSRRFSITVPWRQWHVGGRSGVYVVGVKIRGDNPDGGRENPGVARTLMPVMAPKTTVRQVRTAMMLPLRHRPTQLNGSYFAGESLVDAMKPGGRLARLVQSGTGKKVSWLIDPSTLDEARQLAKEYRTDGRVGAPKQPSQVARDWLAALDRAVAPAKQVTMLPYGDPDVRTLEATGLGRIVDASRELASAAEPPLGKPVQSAIWLENGFADAATLAALTGDQTSSRPDDLTLLSSWAWAPDQRPDLDSSPLVSVTTPAGPVRAVVADQGLTSGGPDPVILNGPVQVRQRFVAETALLAMAGDGTAPVTVVAAPARGFDVLGSATAVLLQGMSAPWITPIGIDEVTGPATQTVEAPAPKQTLSVLNESQLDAVRAIDQDIATYNDLQRHSAAFKANLDRVAVRAASMAWRGFQPDGDHYRRYQLGTFRQTFGQVRIITADGGQDTVVTLSASKGQFPLTIENGTKAPIRVGLRIESLNRDDLTVESIEPRVIRGGNRYSFTIRASAQQNGVIKARAHLVTENGQEFGTPLELDIRAAQYGTVGWVLVAAAVALLFGTSAFRIFRRIRRERRTGATEATLAARVTAAAPKGTDG